MDSIPSLGIIFPIFITPGQLEVVKLWDTLQYVTSSKVCLFDVLATSKVIPAWALTCDSAHSWQLYSIAPLGGLAAITMTRYPTQSDYPSTAQPDLVLSK